MKLLLDTNVVIDLAAEGLDGVSRSNRSLIEDEDNILYLSSISITEIAVKNAVGKLSLGINQIQKAAEDLKLTFMAYTQDHASRLFGVPLHHRDPFDRMLIATALMEGVPIVTSDRGFEPYRDLGLDIIYA